MTGKSALALKIHPLTPRRWGDLTKLFGERGACGGCWCMWWRLPLAQWRRQKGEANRKALRSVVNSGRPPGLLAYVKDEPVGWCAFAPREDYPRLAGSRLLKPVDDQPVWSITCFFVARTYRRRGVTVALLREAVRYAARRGAKILEGYPSEPMEGNPAVGYFHGLVPAFRKAGFSEVAPRSP